MQASASSHVGNTSRRPGAFHIATGSVLPRITECGTVADLLLLFFDRPMQLFVVNGAIMLIALLVIVAGSELFTNAAEHFGEAFGLSEGLIGSVFAAVATALPETLVPIVAVAGGGADGIGDNVGVGAIIGSSFMLSTLALFLLAVFALTRRGLTGAFTAEPTGLRRDLRYFLCGITVAGISLFVPAMLVWPRVLVCIGLVALYIAYVAGTIRRSSELVEAGHGTMADQRLWITHLGLPGSTPTTMIQTVLALTLIVVGAKGFVHGIEHLAQGQNLPVLVMSLLLVPIATEMPEKINSIVWLRRQRDTLAFGNVTGAMVFQATLLPAFGVFLASWQPRIAVLAAFAATLVCGAWVWLHARTGRLTPLKLLFNGLVYIAFIVFIIVKHP